jgi:hypothetical protein
MTAITALHSLVADLGHRAARDGDCVPTSLAIRARLQEHGFPGTLMAAAGWSEPNLLAFMHVVVICGDLVLDGSATQFGLSFPPLIISTQHEYVERWKETGLAAMTFHAYRQ